MIAFVALMSKLYANYTALALSLIGIKRAKSRKQIRADSALMSRERSDICKNLQTFEYSFVVESGFGIQCKACIQMHFAMANASGEIIRLFFIITDSIMFQLCFSGERIRSLVGIAIVAKLSESFGGFRLETSYFRAKARFTLLIWQIGKIILQNASNQPLHIHVHLQ